MQKIEIDKYLIVNSNREVLVFVHEGEPTSDIFLPRKTRYDHEEVKFQRRLIKLLERHVLNDDNKVFLYEQPMYYHPDNPNAVETHDPVVKRYFACVTELDEYVVGIINTICNECNILPYFIPLDVLKNRAWKSIKVPSSKRKIAIDIDLPKPIKILEYKLDYVEY